MPIDTDDGILGLPAPETREVIFPHGRAVLLALGSVLHILAYGSLEPLAVALAFFLVGLMLLLFFEGRSERLMFTAVFAVGWAMGGLAAIYANIFHDPFQTQEDAGRFLALVTRGANGMSIEDIRAITEGAGAVVLWRAIYNLFAMIGFEKGAYIGIAFNIFSVATSGVLTIKMSRLIYGDDSSRERLLVSLYCFCGIFWIFEAIHLRDAVVLLGVTASCYTFIQYIEVRSAANLVLLAIALVTGLAFFGLLRTEFLFVPPALLLAGVTALMLFDSRSRRRGFTIVVATLALALLIIGYLKFQDSFIDALVGGYQGYVSESAETASKGSLGEAVIVNQSLPLRLLFGSAYLYVFPIPFWGGITQNSIYHLFKSLNALFFYAVIPLLGTAFINLARKRSLRTPSIMFLAFIIVGFTAAIAMTSLENRHMAAFFSPLFVFAVAPDFTMLETRQIYQRLLTIFLSLMSALHLVWFVVKL